MPNQVKTAQIDAQRPRWAWKSVVDLQGTTETAHRQVHWYAVQVVARPLVCRPAPGETWALIQFMQHLPNPSLGGKVGFGLLLEIPEVD